MSPSALAWQQIDAAAEKRFLNEAPQAWKKIENQKSDFAAKNHSWTKKRESVNLLLNKRQASTSKYLGTSYFLHEIFDEYEGKEIVIGKNAQYSFLLSRQIGSPGWRLEEIRREESFEEYLGGWEGFWLETLQADSQGPVILVNPFFMFNEKVLFSDLDDFKIEHASFGEFEGHTTVIIGFKTKWKGMLKNEKTGKYENADQYVKGEWIFAPDDDWALLQQELLKYSDESCKKLNFHQKKTLKFEIGFTGKAQPKQSTFQVWDQNGKEVSSSQGTVSSKRERHREADFTVSVYGFPEPDWYQPPKPWWFYTSIVGMVLVVVGAVVFHFGKRLWREGAAKQNNKKRR